MIIGETVTLERYTKGQPDAMGDPVLISTTEDIENVLVQPGTTDDLTVGNRPDGITVVYTLHFPKGLESYDFRGAVLKSVGTGWKLLGTQRITHRRIRRVHGIILWR